MLAIGRKFGERIIIHAGGERIVVEVAGKRKGEIVLCFDAPRSVTIHREEVQRQIDDTEASS